MTATTDEVAAVTREVLESSNLNEISEKQLRQLVKERTGADTSLPDLKALIHSVVEEFLSHEGQEEEEEEAAEDKGALSGRSKKRRAEEEGAEEEDHEDEEPAAKRPVKKGGKPHGPVGAKKFEVGDSGELIVCKLSGKRKLTVGEYKGKLFVSIREFYEKDGQEKPGKGISLPEDQWDILTQHIDDVHLAIKQAKR